MSTVGDRMKAVRIKMGFSQVDFAKKIGVSKQTLYKYENNVITNIPSDKIEAAAHLCKISPAELMGWVDAAEDQAPATTEDTLEHLTPREKAHLRNYRDLDDDNKTRVEGLTASLLSAQQEAADYLIAAHARTDIEASEEMVNADLELLKKKARW